MVREKIKKDSILTENVWYSVFAGPIEKQGPVDKMSSMVRSIFYSLVISCSFVHILLVLKWHWDIPG